MSSVKVTAATSIVLRSPEQISIPIAFVGDANGSVTLYLNRQQTAPEVKQRLLVTKLPGAISAIVAVQLLESSLPVDTLALLVILSCSLPLQPPKLYFLHCWFNPFASVEQWFPAPVASSEQTDGVGHVGPTHQLHLRSFNGMLMLLSVSMDSAQLWSVDQVETRTGGESRPSGYQGRLLGGQNTSIPLRAALFLPSMQPSASDLEVCSFLGNAFIVWSAKSREMRRFLPIPTEVISSVGDATTYSMTVSPDGRWIAVAASGANEIILLSLRSYRISTIALPRHDRVQTAFLASSIHFLDATMLQLLTSNGSIVILPLSRQRRSMIGRISLPPPSPQGFLRLGNNSFILLQVNGFLSFATFSTDAIQWTSTISTDTTESSSAAAAPAPSSSSASSATAAKASAERTRSPVTAPMNLSLDNVKSLLTQHGHYPNHSRFAIWKFLLRTPRNHSAYQRLVTMPLYSSLPTTLLHDDQKDSIGLIALLNALAQWSNVLGEAAFIPALVKPFLLWLRVPKRHPHHHRRHDDTTTHMMVSPITTDPLGVFEVIASILFNWCRDWFLLFPHPPLRLLTISDLLLSKHDAALHSHFQQRQISATNYIWPIQRTLFSELFVEDSNQWLMIWDHLLSQPLFLFVTLSVVAVSHYHDLLMTMQTPAEVERFLQAPHLHRSSGASSSGDATLAQSLLREAYALYSLVLQDPIPYTTITKLPPSSKSEADLLQSVATLTPSSQFVPLTGETYPRFELYPPEAVDQQRLLHDLIQAQEDEIEHSRHIFSLARKELNSFEMETDRWRKSRELLRISERQRREEFELDAERRAAEKMRLDRLARETRLQQVLHQEDYRKHLQRDLQQMYVEHQQQLAQEMQRQQREGQYDIATRLEDEVIQSLEFRSRLQMQASEAERDAQLAAERLRTSLQLQSRRKAAELDLQNEVWKHEDRQRQDHLRLQQDVRDRLRTHDADAALRDSAYQQLAVHAVESELNLRRLHSNRTARLDREELGDNVDHAAELDHRRRDVRRQREAQPREDLSGLATASHDQGTRQRWHEGQQRHQQELHAAGDAARSNAAAAARQHGERIATAFDTQTRTVYERLHQQQPSSSSSSAPS